MAPNPCQALLAFPERWNRTIVYCRRCRLRTRIGPGLTSSILWNCPNPSCRHTHSQYHLEETTRGLPCCTSFTFETAWTCWCCEYVNPDYGYASPRCKMCSYPFDASCRLVWNMKKEFLQLDSEIDEIEHVEDPKHPGLVSKPSLEDFPEWRWDIEGGYLSEWDERDERSRYHPYGFTTKPITSCADDQSKKMFEEAARGLWELRVSGDWELWDFVGAMVFCRVTWGLADIVSVLLEPDTAGVKDFEEVGMFIRQESAKKNREVEQIMKTFFSNLEDAENITLEDVMEVLRRAIYELLPVGF